MITFLRNSKKENLRLRHDFQNKNVSVVSLSKNINPSLELVQPRKSRPFITERLLMVRKELNQTNKNPQAFLLEYRIPTWTDSSPTSPGLSAGIQNSYMDRLISHFPRHFCWNTEFLHRQTHLPLPQAFLLEFKIPTWTDSSPTSPGISAGI